MKRLLVIFTVLTIFLTGSCKKNAQTNSQNNTPETTVGETMLTGKVERTDFLNPPYNQWFQEEYEKYQVDEKTLSKLDDENLNELSVVIVMGTWCPDSRREVPRFFKVIDNLGFLPEQVTIYCVDRNFKAGNADIQNYNVKKVPTFIFYKNKSELGRIVETPKKTLEKDIVKILK